MIPGSGIVEISGAGSGEDRAIGSAATAGKGSGGSALKPAADSGAGGGEPATEAAGSAPEETQAIWPGVSQAVEKIDDHSRA
jgi:hypothetical protein